MQTIKSASGYLPTRRAFTLIDLLAVISAGVLILLALVPALARSRTAPLQVVCLSNLRHVMQGILMYATENRDYLPYPNWGNGVKGWLYSPGLGSPPRNPSLSDYQKGQIWPYVAEMNTYRCPADISKYYIARANQLSTYVMNGAVCGYGALAPPRTWQLQRFDERAFCLWEPDENLGNPPIGPFAYNDASAFPDRNEGPGRKHPGGTPVGTFGGNARWLSMSAFRAEQLKATQSLLWCNPANANGR